MKLLVAGKTVLVALLACLCVPSTLAQGAKGYCKDTYNPTTGKCEGETVGDGKITHAECIKLDAGMCWRTNNAGKGHDARVGACFKTYVAATATAEAKCEGFIGGFSKHQCKCNKGGKCWDFDGPEKLRDRRAIRRLLRSLQAEDVEEIVCPVTMGGDPHLKTWTGKWFDYMGECDLVMLDAPQLNMTIHARTSIRGDYSIIANAAVRIDEEVFELGGWGAYHINGVASGNADLDQLTLSGYEITYKQTNKKTHVYDIAITESEYLSLKTFKDWVSVRIVGAKSEHFGDSVGLLGDFYTGKRLGRDGTTVIASDTDFGQEWQCRDTDPMIFETIRAPQYPEACRLPVPANTATGRRLLGTISHEVAERACAGWGEEKEECIEDVIKSGDLEVAEAGGY